MIKPHWTIKGQFPWQNLDQVRIFWQLWISAIRIQTNANVILLILKKSILLILQALLLCGSLLALDFPDNIPQKTLLKNCTMYTMTDSGVVDSGAVLIQSDHIAAVFAADSLIPFEYAQTSDSVKVVDMGGKSIMPGLIDMHSALGVEYPEDTHYPDQSVLRYFLPEDEEIHSMLRGGVTTIALRPPADSLFSGYSALVKLLPDSLGGTHIIDDTLDYQISLTGPMVDLNSKQSKDLVVSPLARMYRFRKFLDEAYSDADYLPDYSTLLEENPNWPPVFRDDLPLYVLSNRAVQILEAHSMLIDAGANFYFGGVLGLADVYNKWTSSPIASTQKYINGVVLGPAFFQIDPEYNRYRPLSTELSDLGIIFAVGSHFPNVQSLTLLDRMRDFVRYGMSEQQAMDCGTIVPAKLLNRSQTLGKIQSGAAADLVILNGDPFDVKSRVEQVYVDGIAVWLK